MAYSKTLLSTFFIPLILTFLFSTLVASYHQRISPSSIGFHEEKLTHIRFFFHDIVTGPKASMVIVASPLMGKSSSPLPFGSMVVMEDPLTVGPELDSKLVGKAQGFYISASQQAKLDLEIVMGMSFVFMEGEFNGSTLSVLGRNSIVTTVREMPIVGGTGVFRFARGFVRARSLQVDYEKGDALVEYNVYVLHYLTTSSSSQEDFNDGVQFMAHPIFR
ncbi:pterocarpan synthase 1-like [Gastrolobium bilobum]|uniref:pterocarpan synthase 1-like n=1 Tax=Gastrolobium bilobum TaxID=150636 RepID=UPI002AB1C555|nr:pterocarpan synthase 1-like [Gastrolobium bilobum]